MNSNDIPPSSQDSHPVDDSPDQQDSGSFDAAGWFRRSFSPFRIATLRGLAIVLPPLLTVVLFVWAWNAIDRAILNPVEALARHTLVWTLDESIEHEEAQKRVQEGSSIGAVARFSERDGERLFVDESGKEYLKIQSTWLPEIVVRSVNASPGSLPLTTAHAYYCRYVQMRYLKRQLVIPAALAIFLAVMYLLGKLLAAGVGRFFYHLAEAIIHRVPIIRNVYSSVKQVTDFVISDNEVQFRRVVAVEYPRKGIWSIGFVTGDGMKEIQQASGEPMLTVLMPTSPMPATGFAITVPKSEVIELDVTMDQAIQFCVSCGVVVPPSQLAKPVMEGAVKQVDTSTEI